MPLSPAKSKCRGVTLMEMMIVVAIAALLAGLAFPSVAAGIDSLRLRSAADSIRSLFAASSDRALRRQQVVEVLVSPQQNALLARSPDLSFQRRLDLPDSVRIAAIGPGATVPTIDGLAAPRSFLLYPGGTVPRISIDLISVAGRRRLLRTDPLSGLMNATDAGGRP